MKRFRNATQWGIYDIAVESGRIVDVKGIDEDPEASAIGQVLLDGVQHDSRIQRPAIRKGWLENLIADVIVAAQMSSTMCHGTRRWK